MAGTSIFFLFLKWPLRPRIKLVSFHLPIHKYLQAMIDILLIHKIGRTHMEPIFWGSDMILWENN